MRRTFFLWPGHAANAPRCPHNIAFNSLLHYISVERQARIFNYYLVLVSTHWRVLVTVHCIVLTCEVLMLQRVPPHKALAAPPAAAAPFTFASLSRATFERVRRTQAHQHTLMHHRICTLLYRGAVEQPNTHRANAYGDRGGLRSPGLVGPMMLTACAFLFLLCLDRLRLQCVRLSSCQ